MNSLEQTPDTGIKNMIITIVFIFSVLATLITLSFYIAGTSS
jgi:hypothetical protein